MQSPFALFASATDRELAKVAEYLKVENRIPRDKLPNHITLTSHEHSHLLKLGQKVGSALKDLFVSYHTFTRWADLSPPM